MEKDELPTEYWQIISEIDTTIFCIEVMVDRSTGYATEQEETLQYWADRLKKLVALLPKDDPHLNQAKTITT